MRIGEGMIGQAIYAVPDIGVGGEEDGSIFLFRKQLVGYMSITQGLDRLSVVGGQVVFTIRFGHVFMHYFVHQDQVTILGGDGFGAIEHVALGISTINV